MTNTQVLVVDDDLQIGLLLSDFLSQFHYQVTHVRDGVTMKRSMRDTLFDIVLLDIMLPNTDGFKLCQDIRKASDVPIIMISALDQDSDRILGLEMGADDYLPKPFNTRELLARMKALLRRTTGELKKVLTNQGKIIKFNNWQLDRHAHTLIDEKGLVVPLSCKEHQLILLFLEYPKQVLSRSQIMDRLYDKSFDVFDRTIDVLIGRLRKKFEKDYKNPTMLLTVRGEGYLLSAKVSKNV